MNETSIISTPFGNLKLGSSANALTYCNWTMEKPASHNGSALLQEALKQLNAYFQQKLQAFDLPLEAIGSPFQMQVWDALQSVPYGKTCSYRDIALLIQNPKSVRAVGNANGKNPLCIFIPCHRVIHASGRLGGYSAGLGYKEKLLAMEKR